MISSILLITREVEKELFPAIRATGMRFYAYNPLAGGFLSGKYKDIQSTPSEGRFVINPQYVDRYWKESYFKAGEKIRELCDKFGFLRDDVAFRWINHHSFLRRTYRAGFIIVGGGAKEYIAFYGTQVKSIYNHYPTHDPDILLDTGAGEQILSPEEIVNQHFADFPSIARIV